MIIINDGRRSNKYITIYKQMYNMILNKTDKGVSPIIGVILLVALFTAIVILLSFNLFSSNIGVVTESMDADIDFTTTENGIEIAIFQNENINRILVQHEDGRTQELDMNTDSPQDVNFGPGRYYLIGENDSNERLLSTKNVNELLNIQAPTFVSTNDEIEYDIETNIDEENITSYKWDFGDGDTSTEPKPTNTYTSDGIFETELTIVANDDEITNNIEIIVDASSATSTEPDDTEEVHNNLDGDGTTQTPYIIRDDHDLQSMKEDLDANYILGQNINASKTEEWYNGDGFEPIGDFEDEFTGNLDGDGHSIIGLEINRNEKSFIGLFGHTNDAEISDVRLTDIDITGQSDVGGIVGINENSTIMNSSTKGNVFGEGNLRIGGLVGYNTGSSTIMNSNADVVVVGNNNNVGGIVGKNENSIIKESYALGDIESNKEGDEENNLGGIAGINIDNGEIRDSYAQGNITGINNIYVGGVVGYNKEGTVTNTYSTSIISSDATIGGLSGKNDDIFTDSYWNSEIGESESIGNNTATESNTVGLITEDMQGQSAEDNMIALDFEEIWKTVSEPNNDYPELQN